MTLDDTIVAISSAVGPAARMIVRLSGASAFDVAARVARPMPPHIAGVTTSRVSWCEFEVPCSVWTFVAPRSSTGQDVVELHLPGNPRLVRDLVRSIVAAGARPAEAGEFTARAYFNGRIDLAQAEGIAAMIAAANDQGLRAARRLLGGDLARRLQPSTDALADLLARVEAGIDFSDEDVTLVPAPDLLRRIAAIDADLNHLLRESRRFDRLTHEPSVVLVGRPNAGKSTLLNALAGVQRAVVSPQAGTTRDVIWAEVALARGLVRLMDVAGIDTDLETTVDRSAEADVTRQMRARAEQAAYSADVLVLVVDPSEPRPAILPRAADLVVHTKADRRSSYPASGAAVPLQVSAITGQNLDELRRRLDELAFGASDDAGAAGGVVAGLALNDRHIRAIGDARSALARASMAAAALVPAGEVVALELREALDALGSVVGQITPDDVLGRIFGAFCIGK